MKRLSIALEEHRSSQLRPQLHPKELSTLTNARLQDIPKTHRRLSTMICCFLLSPSVAACFSCLLLCSLLSFIFNVRIDLLELELLGLHPIDHLEYRFNKWVFNHLLLLIIPKTNLL